MCDKLLVSSTRWRIRDASHGFEVESLLLQETWTEKPELSEEVLAEALPHCYEVEGSFLAITVMLPTAQVQLT